MRWRGPTDSRRGAKGGDEGRRRSDRGGGSIGPAASSPPRARRWTVPMEDRLGAKGGDRDVAGRSRRRIDWTGGVLAAVCAALECPMENRFGAKGGDEGRRRSDQGRGGGSIGPAASSPPCARRWIVRWKTGSARKAATKDVAGPMRRRVDWTGGVLAAVRAALDGPDGRQARRERRRRRTSPVRCGGGWIGSAASGGVLAAVRAALDGPDGRQARRERRRRRTSPVRCGGGSIGPAASSPPCARRWTVPMEDRFGAKGGDEGRRRSDQGVPGVLAAAFLSAPTGQGTG